MCPDLEELEVVGHFYSDVFTYLELGFSPCKNKDYCLNATEQHAWLA
jgi:hypothetical protein